VGYVVMHFPDGSREYRYSDQGPETPEPGDVIWRNGEPFRVMTVSSEHHYFVATVESDADTIGHMLPPIGPDRPPRKP
jgi:hypothetical protein